jgi:exodeoxyribonuclease-5
LPFVRLLIVDEASMINQEMFNLIKQYNLKTLYIGDHFQLPPVGDSFNIMLNPDFKMEKILRQNEDNHIIQLAEMVRRGQKIPLGVYGKSKHTLKFNKQDLLNYDEIITWTNKTKDMINEAVREQLGFLKDVPQMDDKMIVRMNCPAKNICNGQIIYIMNNPKLNKHGAWKVEFVDELAYNDPFIMAQTDEYTKACASIHLSKDELEKIRITPSKWKRIPNTNFTKFVPSEEKSPYQIHLDWGYAITAHAAQGSSWKNIAVMLDKRIYHLKDGYRWIYTAITRAEESVVIYSGDF